MAAHPRAAPPLTTGEQMSPRNLIIIASAIAMLVAVTYQVVVVDTRPQIAIAPQDDTAWREPLPDCPTDKAAILLPGNHWQCVKPTNPAVPYGVGPCWRFNGDDLSQPTWTWICTVPSPPENK